LVLPVLLLSSFFSIGFYYFRSSFDAYSFFTAISGLFSSLVISLILWERLRDSLSKRLDYLDENVYLGLLCELKRELPLWRENQIEKAIGDLQKHGKYLHMPLFPKNLVIKLRNLVLLQDSFYERMEQLLAIARKRLNKEPNRYSLLAHLKLIRDEPSQTEYTDYANTATLMSLEHAQLINDNKEALVTVSKERKNILVELEDFLKENSLRLKPEPVRMVSSISAY
jgi:hypothetical protein